MATVTAVLEVKDFKAEVPPDWCPGCGDFGVLNGLFHACAELGRRPDEVLVVSGIGCSSNLPGFFRSYGVHSLHGRALPFATGAKLANHGMTVIVTGGWGGGPRLGLDHFIPALRRNKHNSYEWFRKRVYRLEDTPHDPNNFHTAMDAALEWGEKIPIGLFYRDRNPRPSLHTQDPGLQAGVLVQQPVGVHQEERRKLIEEFM